MKDIKNVRCEGVAPIFDWSTIENEFGHPVLEYLFWYDYNFDSGYFWVDTNHDVIKALKTTMRQYEHQQIFLNELELIEAFRSLGYTYGVIIHVE